MLICSKPVHLSYDVLIPLTWKNFHSVLDRHKLKAFLVWVLPCVPLGLYCHYTTVQSFCPDWTQLSFKNIQLQTYHGLKSPFATRQGISRQIRQIMQKRNPQKARCPAFSIIVLTMIISRHFLCIRQCVDPSLLHFFLNDHLSSKAEMSHTFNPTLGR